jgi:hypothetical protein
VISFTISASSSFDQLEIPVQFIECILDVSSDIAGCQILQAQTRA